MKKRKPNSQAESSLDKKSPDKSTANNDESRCMKLKSRNFADCEPVLNVVLNGLLKVQDWKSQKRRKQKNQLYLETRAVGLKTHLQGISAHPPFAVIKSRGSLSINWESIFQKNKRQTKNLVQGNQCLDRFLFLVYRNLIYLIR